MPCPKYESLSGASHQYSPGEPWRKGGSEISSDMGFLLPSSYFNLCLYSKDFAQRADTSNPSQSKANSGSVKPWAVFISDRAGLQFTNISVAVSLESTKTTEDSFGLLNTLFLICGGPGEVSHLLKYNSLQNTKQMHAALCRRITLCVHVTHTCSILAVHLVDVWETPRFKVSSVSFVL